MKLSPTTALLGLLTLAHCAPSPSPARPPAALAARASINDCNDSTFTDTTSSTSPAVSDCQTLASNIAGGGTWTIFPTDQRQLAQFGSCAFGVTAAFSWTTAWVKVGNQDIIDLIHSSAQMFASEDGLVGAKGAMGCQAGPVTENDEVQWEIYHT